MKNILPVVICLLSALFLASCQQNETVGDMEGRVEATEAYLQSFGEPPQGKKGRAFARVGYLPLKNNPGMVRPLPVYLFSDGYHVHKILKRLASKELLLPENSDFYKPFPDDLDIAASPPQNGLQIISLSSRLNWSLENQKAAAIALSETALQFNDIEKVSITLNGSPFEPISEEGYTHNPDKITEPGPPELVVVAAAWEKGQTDPEELMIEFNRPVTVNSFRIFFPDGDVVEGDYYTSIFQMAVIIHPDNPGRIKEGVEFRVEWDVVDTLGRTGKGSTTLPLHRYDH